MAKQSKVRNGKSLVIVESPAKAKTIGKFLGSDFIVEASIGHVRDLPEGASQIPAKYKEESWARLGVNVDDGFSPLYVIPPGKSAHVRKLQALLKDAKDLYLATDEDREGEAISWHLTEILKPKVPVKRLVFHEITREAIKAALDHPRDIDLAMVRAQEARRVIDRLYGYEVSPLLWRKIGPKLSAGRVQSVAVRLTVAREKERMAFVSATYWDLLGMFAKTSGESFQAVLISVNGKKIPVGKDFDTTTGKLKSTDFLQMTEVDAQQLIAKLRSGKFKIDSVEDKPYTTRPYPPFTTSTLQQEANRKLSFTARRTMQVAQSLYENGHITYMRTDSTNLAASAIEAARKLVAEQYGPEYLPAAPRVYQTKVKNAQEAHEAIRPAGNPFEFPEELKSKLNHDEFRLYDLIWKRTVASQMADARGRRLTIVVAGEGSEFQVGGKTIEFPGYLRAYVEGSDDPLADIADQETVLPSVTVGEAIACKDLNAKSHTTQPPSRYSEAALTRALEEMGIGRPSTYASIIDTILAREYVFKKDKALVPTWVAFAVAKLLESHLASLVDYQFTAQMEDELDAISRGEQEYGSYLKNFYFGNGKPGLKKQLDHKIDEIDAREISRIPIGLTDDGEEIVVRVGRYGPFVQLGERRASLPEGIAPDEVTIERALELLSQAAQAEEPLGVCPDTNKPVFMKVGRFGPYVQRGTPDDEEKPRNASLMKGMKPEDVDLATALKLLSLPRELGPNPTNSEMVTAFNGRFGPYVKCGEETRSLPADVSPLDVTLAQAIELLAQPKAMRRGFGAKKEPLKVFAASPITQQPVQLLEGRYGPYVADGVTNASLPKTTVVEQLTFEEALTLLAERAARGPVEKKGRGRFAKKAVKSATPKKAAKKKTATTEDGVSAPKSTSKPAKKSAKKKAAKKKSAVPE